MKKDSNTQVSKSLDQENKELENKVYLVTLLVLLAWNKMIHDFLLFVIFYIVEKRVFDSMSSQGVKVDWVRQV